MSTSPAQNGTAGLSLPVPIQLRVPQVLIVLVLLGAAITFIDGFTTRYNDDWEYIATDALSYKAPPAAMLFAVITLPLVFTYARRENASRTEALLLWYILGVTAYTKDFAYLKIPGIPLFITDYILGVLLVRHFVWPRIRWYSLRSLPMLTAAALLCIGAVSAMRGFLGGQSPLLVMRDFGLVAYVLYLPIALLVFRTWDSIRRLLLIFCSGSTMLSLYAIGLAISNPGQRRYVLIPVLLAGAFVISFVGLQNEIFSRRFGWFLVACNGLGLLLSNARTAFVAVLGACGLIFLLGPTVQRTSIMARVRIVVSEFLSGVLDPSQDATAEFRFLAWAEAINRFSRQPVLGEGYGVPFTFDGYDGDPRPHNTYLTFLYKSGAIGFLVLAGVLSVFYLKALIAIRRPSPDRHTALLYVIGLALVTVSAEGMFTFVFESPFISAPYWILVACGYRALYLLGEKVTIGQHQ
jgi:hypothetical protein